MFGSSNDESRRSRTRKSASGRWITFGLFSKPQPNAARDVRMSQKVTAIRIKARKAGVLPLVNLILRGHAHEVDEWGRIWVHIEELRESQSATLF